MNVQFPLASVVVVPMMVPLPSVRVIVDPGSAVPLKVVVSLVTSPDTGFAIDGAFGAVASTTKVVVTGPATLPAVSVSETLTVLLLSGKVLGIVKV